MNRIISAIGLIALALASSGHVRADSGELMERLKSLEGDWMVLDEQGEATDQVGARFRLTANGSALQEFMFPDAPHEMLNVYTLSSLRNLVLRSSTSE